MTGVNGFVGGGSVGSGRGSGSGGGRGFGTGDGSGTGNGSGRGIRVSPTPTDLASVPPLTSTSCGGIRRLRTSRSATNYRVPAATLRLSFTLFTPSVAFAIETALALASAVFTVPLSVTLLFCTSTSMSLSFNTVFQSAMYCA